MTVGGIMAAGSGTRLRALGQRKALVELNGKRLIEHVAHQMADAEVDDLIIAIPEKDTYLEGCARGLTQFKNRITIVHVAPGGGTGAAVRAILTTAEDRPCLLSTVDTIAPQGAYQRLRSVAEDMVPKPLVVILATSFIHDPEPIWVHLDSSRNYVTQIGKKVPPASLCFGNVRWFSPEAAEFLLQMAQQRPERDTTLMHNFVESMSDRVRVLVIDPIFDIDDPSDAELAGKWLLMNEKGSVT